MLTRIEIVNKHEWDNDDKVIVFDVDMFFLDDPFKIFQNQFDYFYTTRSDIKSSSDPINAGHTGFVYSDKINNFYRYLIKQLSKPSWDKLITIKNKIDINGMYDQQFLCVIYKNINNLPEEINNIKFYDATCYWNYTTVNDNFNDIYNKIKNKTVGVVHLKGSILKQNKYVVEFLKVL